jgi:hypothetical protein
MQSEWLLRRLPKKNPLRNRFSLAYRPGNSELISGAKGKGWPHNWAIRGEKRLNFTTSFVNTMINLTLKIKNAIIKPSNSLVS